MSAYVGWLVAQKREWHHPPDPDERYIENNPVKAGLVHEAKEWAWGSAKWRPEGLGLQPVQRRKPNA